MTEEDLNILKDLAENFEKADGGINYFASDSTTYTEEEYDDLEKELKQNIDDTIITFKNKYLVFPIFKVENCDEIKVSLKWNRYSISPSTLYSRMLGRQNDHQ